jgi:hypothetical protein
MGCIAVIPWHLPEGTGEDHEKPQPVSGIRLKHSLPQYTAVGLHTHP